MLIVLLQYYDNKTDYPTKELCYRAGLLICPAWSIFMAKSFRMNLLARLIFLLLVLSMACHSSFDERVHRSGNNAGPIAAVESRRMRLIEAIRHLDTALVSKDKRKIRELFRWPLPYGNAAMFVTDSAMYAEETKTGVLTANMYDRYEPLVDSLIRAQVRTIVGHANLNKLLKEDSMGYTEMFNGEPCCTKYSIQVYGDTVVQLHFDLSTNPNWHSRTKPAVDEPDNCQGITYLTFAWDGNRLWWESLESGD